MTRSILMALAGLLVASSAFAETSTDGLFPIAESDYRPNPVVSLLGGSMTPKEGDAGSVVGVELSLDCPLFQPPTGQVRQQISYTVYDKNQVQVTNIELNPHWMSEISENFTAGFGPGLGLVQTSVSGGESESYFGLGFGASASYRASSLQLGAEYREQLTQTKNEADLNNSRFLVKVGYIF